MVLISFSPKLILFFFKSLNAGGFREIMFDADLLFAKPAPSPVPLFFKIPLAGCPTTVSVVLVTLVTRVLGFLSSTLDFGPSRENIPRLAPRLPDRSPHRKTRSLLIPFLFTSLFLPCFIILEVNLTQLFFEEDTILLTIGKF